MQIRRIDIDPHRFVPPKGATKSDDVKSGLSQRIAPTQSSDISDATTDTNVNSANAIGFNAKSELARLNDVPKVRADIVTQARARYLSGQFSSVEAAERLSHVFLNSDVI
ncbi:hypothetical protein SH668x_000817 [Planctomicrobium sp. SH668]|uniref:hypothetical protein n=1 Tax=Planctomicrobium sp. SH668 TaxID=3448126 RepID=UPI003F5BE653